mgnify:CR=1 FL=1
MGKPNHWKKVCKSAANIGRDHGRGRGQAKSSTGFYGRSKKSGVPKPGQNANVHWIDGDYSDSDHVAGQFSDMTVNQITVSSISNMSSDTRDEAYTYIKASFKKNKLL